MTDVSSPKNHDSASTSTPGTAVRYLPLSSENESADRSIGTLISDATRHFSTLIRSEVELAKAEISNELKKGLKGSLFFIIAAVIALYSSFFFFFFLGELLSLWLPSWAAYGIVFAAMLLAAALFGLLGYLKVKKIRAPERTIKSVKETASAIKPQSH